MCLLFNVRYWPLADFRSNAINVCFRGAVVTDIGWIKHVVQLFGFLMPGTTKLFSSQDAEQARAWVCA